MNESIPSSAHPAHAAQNPRTWFAVSRGRTGCGAIATPQAYRGSISTMTVISMLRAVNLASHNRISMEALRAIYEELGFREVRTYVQSGNVVFETSGKDLARMAKRIED